MSVFRQDPCGFLTENTSARLYQAGHILCYNNITACGYYTYGWPADANYTTRCAQGIMRHGKNNYTIHMSYLWYNNRKAVIIPTDGPTPRTAGMPIIPLAALMV